MTDEQMGLIGREFRHFKMHLRRDAPAAKRSGWVSEANCETYPPTEGRCRRQSLEWCRKAPRRQVPRRAKRVALRSKVARGCAVSNKIESLVAEGKLSPSQAVRLHALAQLAYEGIMDDLAAGGGAAKNGSHAQNGV